MTGLLVKDLLIILRNLSPYYLLVILFSLPSAFGSPEMFPANFGMMSHLAFAMQVFISMELDFSSGWMRLVPAMPISVFSEVAEKYVLSAILAAMATVFSLLAFGALALAGVARADLTFSVVAAGLLSSLPYVAIMIPAMYKFGPTHSRYVFIGFVFLLTSLPFLASYLGIDVFSLLSSLEPHQFLPALLLGMLAFMMGSFAISVHARGRTRGAFEPSCGV